MPGKIPLTLDDFQAVIADRRAMNQMARDGSFKRFVDQYALASNRADPGVVAQVKDHFDRSISAMVEQAGGNPKNAVATAQALLRSSDLCAKQGLYSRTAVGACLDGVYASNGDVFRGSFRQRNPNSAPAVAARAVYDKAIAKMPAAVRNSAGSVIPADGGFLIAEETRSDLVMASLEFSTVRSRAAVFPMGSLRLNIPAVDETSRSASVLGGLVASWSEEGSDSTAGETLGQFARTTLESKKLLIYSQAPNETVNDGAGAWDAVVDTMFPRAIAWWEDEAYFNGTGTGEPLGWLNSPAAIKIDPAVSSQVAWADITAMLCRLLPPSLSRACWITHADMLPYLLALSFEGAASSDVPTGALSFDTGTGLWRLLGRPVIVSEHSPALGTDGALALVDLSYYAIGDRQVATVFSSPHLKFLQDITVFRVTERADGRPWLNSAITPRHGSNTQSAFVLLSGTHT